MKKKAYSPLLVFWTWNERTCLGGLLYRKFDHVQEDLYHIQQVIMGLRYLQSINAGKNQVRTGLVVRKNKMPPWMDMKLKDGEKVYIDRNELNRFLCFTWNVFYIFKFLLICILFFYFFLCFFFFFISILNMRSFLPLFFLFFNNSLLF